MTPSYLRLAHNAFARSVPGAWDHSPSIYGPLATIVQFLAARLGGASAARIVFWLKLWAAGAFILVTVVIDRLLRADPARRLRAHLLWTINPLLLWDLVAAGHLDVLAAAAGLLGLLVLGEEAGPARRPRLLRALAAGALIGIAADVKINYLLFGLGVAWALRRAPGADSGRRSHARRTGAELRVVQGARSPRPGCPPQRHEPGQLL
jgi:4-amino-4-deoxy-L-arabinose transferase-like glycosyltransferase